MEIFLGGERNLLALHDLGDVQIEEIAVENGLFFVFFTQTLSRQKYPPVVRQDNGENLTKHTKTLV